LTAKDRLVGLLRFIFVVLRCAGALTFLLVLAGLKVASQDVLPTSLPEEVELAVVRYVPGKKANDYISLDGTQNLPKLIEALGKNGQVNILYHGNRSFYAISNDYAARFDSLDRRPAFSMDPKLNGTLTNRQFGMQLEVRGMALTNGLVVMAWNGQFSWSSELLDLWAGEKFLMFGMRVAKLINPAMVYDTYDENEDEEPAQGVNLRSLFKKKEKKGGAKKDAAPAPSQEVVQVSYLNTEIQQVRLNGTEFLRANEFSIFQYNGRTNQSAPEQILLFVKPTVPDL
jgi:hypothetical protein